MVGRKDPVHLDYSFVINYLSFLGRVYSILLYFFISMIFFGYNEILYLYWMVVLIFYCFLLL